VTSQTFSLARLADLFGPRALLLSIVLGATALLTACGSDGGSPEPPAVSPTQTPTAPTAPSSTAPAPSPTAAGGGTELTITFDDGYGKVSTWQLTCDPSGGTHPDPQAACAALAKSAAKALPAVAKDRMCTQQLGGEQTAVVTGTWRGSAVDSQLNLRDGCEIARWRALEGLLPKASS